MDGGEHPGQQRPAAAQHANRSGRPSVAPCRSLRAAPAAIGIGDRSSRSVGALRSWRGRVTSRTAPGHAPICSAVISLSLVRGIGRALVRRSALRRPPGRGRRRRKPRRRPASARRRRSPRGRPGGRSGRCGLRARRARPASRPPTAAVAVSVGPGLTALIRIPWPMFSRAAVRVRMLSAALLAAYTPWFCPRTGRPMRETTLTTAPPPPRRMRSISRCRHSHTPVRFTPSTASHSARGVSATGPQEGRPALFTAMSSRSGVALDRLEQFAHRRRVGDVDDVCPGAGWQGRRPDLAVHKRRAAPLRRRFVGQLDGLPQRRGGPPGHDHPGAGAGQRHRHGPADARTGPGDQGRPAGQSVRAHSSDLCFTGGAGYVTGSPPASGGERHPAERFGDPPRTPRAASRSCETDSAPRRPGSGIGISGSPSAVPLPRLTYAGNPSPGCGGGTGTGSRPPPSCRLMSISLARLGPADNCP